MSIMQARGFRNTARNMVQNSESMKKLVISALARDLAELRLMNSLGNGYLYKHFSMQKSSDLWQADSPGPDRGTG
jgi:hypothetical protein